MNKHTMGDELLIKFLLRETTPAEDGRVNEWLAADAAHQKRFAQLELIWDTSKNLAAESTLDEDEAWQKFKQKADGLTVEHHARVRTLLPRTWLQIAAMLFLAAGAWAVYSLLRPDYTSIDSVAEVRTETLPDGSVITLNKHTALSWQREFNGNQRKVRLQRGEVFFKVQPNKQKPFVITAGNTQVQVVGTSFNVKYLNGKTEVIVETGIVKVSNGKEQVTLHAGERVVTAPGGSRLEVRQNDDQLYQFYRTRVFVANNTPLSRVIGVLNEAYDVNIVMAGTDIGSLTITTTFKDETLDRTLEIVAETLDLKVEKKDGRIILHQQP